MNLARKLRQRLAQAIASDSRSEALGRSDDLGRADISGAEPSGSRLGRTGHARVSASRGPLQLESLERRQMMAGDVELLFTDPSIAGPDLSAITDQSVSAQSTEREIGNLNAEGEPGLDLVALANWLGDQGFEFYGADWCPACTQQKQLFEDGGDNLPFTEVTLPNANRTIDPQFASLNLTEFPTWILPDNSRLVGVQSIETLIQLSNFTNPTDERPTFEAIGPQTVAIGSPLHIPVDGYDAEGGPLTVTVSVADPSLLSATVLTGNRSLRLDLDGYGDMVFELFEQRAPVAAGRVADLAIDGFYDGIIFHRVVDDFVIQGGDPQGTGSGGSPLGQFDDDFHPDLQHNRSGVLSFAKSSDDTNNSQFFITEVPTRFLDFNHSVFGQLVEGDDVREAISETHVGANDRPTNTVRINNATIFDDIENSVVMLRALGGTGTTNVTFTITDSDGNSFQEIVPVTVTEDVDAQGNAINSQPYLNPIADPIAATGRNATLQLSSVDVEGDPVQYFLSGTSANATATINATTGLVQVTGNEGFTGSVDFAVGVRAATGAGSASDNQVVTFSFNQTAVPTPTSIDLRASSDSGTSSTDNITNIGSLTFDITGVTPGATVQIIDTSDNTVIGVGTATGTTLAVTTNNLAAIGQGTYTLAARQVIGGNTGTASPSITVVYDTTSPVFNTTTVRTTANVNAAYTTDLVSAEEGSGVVYAFTNSPTGATIVPGTGVIDWTPTQTQLGANTFTVQLSDAAGNVRTETFSVNVAEAAVAGIRLELTDLTGNVINSVEVGQQFVLNFYGVDERPFIDRGGIFAAFADVLFDGTLVRAVPGASIEYPVTFGNVRRGTVSSGLINELGAASSLSTPTNEVESLVASLRMQALAAGTVNFVSEPADQSGSEVLLFFNNDRVPVDAVNYGSTTLAIGQTFTAIADTFNVIEDSGANVLNVLANDMIISGSGNLTVVSVTQPTVGGTVALAGGEVRFTPTTDFVGTTQFTYRVSGPGGVQQTVPVTVTVTGVNDPPVGVDDTFIVDAGSTANSLDVLANEAATAEPGETLTVTAVSATTSGGTVTIASDGRSVNYTPPAAFVGTDTFTYTLSDGSGTDTVSVTITVNPTDNPPIAVADTFPATGGAPINEDAAQASYDVLANDARDADNQAFVIQSLGTPSAGGTVSIGNNGTTLLYQPAANFNGTETVTYTIRDTGGGLATTTATFNVTAVNDPPPISDGAITLLRSAGQSTVLRISDLPTNPDGGEVIRFVNLTTPTNGGVATIAADGQSILFTPPGGDFTGQVTFDFEVEDASQLRSGPATMTVTIAQYNERAVAVRFGNTANRFIGGNLSSFTLTGTNILNETISMPLSDSSVIVDADGIRVPGLLPGSYTLNIPAIPFLQNGDLAQAIDFESEIEEGDESIDISLGSIKAEFLSVADWFGSAPRRAVLAVVTPGGNAIFAQPSEAASQALSAITVGLNAAGSAITVNATRATTTGGNTTTAAVSGSANINDGTVIQNRGVAGDMRLVLVNLDDSGGVALTTPTAAAAASMASTASTTTTASGEPLSPAVAAAVSTNDVFVPGVNSASSLVAGGSNATSRTPSGEPLLNDSLFSQQSSQGNVVGGENTSVSDVVDAAMTDVAEELTRISSAEAAVAGGSDESVQTFTEAVDRALTDPS